MKVYAHYKSENETGDGNSYRWRTLLQFGDSWECIGSVFMKNPGSAKPLNPTTPISNKYLLEHLSKFSDNEECGWFHFSDDSTMRHIESLFRTYYKHNKEWNKLNGVIQIFNLMNVMEPKLDKAIEKNRNTEYKYAKTTEMDISQMVFPVYLGWGNLGKTEQFIERTEKIFKEVKKNQHGKYLEQEFSENSFYHPQYLIMYGKEKDKSQSLLRAFCQNSQNPQKEVEPFIKPSLPKNDIYDKVVPRLEKEIEPVEKDEKKCRFKLNEKLILTITTNEDGYIAIRGKDINDDLTSKYSQMFEYFGFLPYKNVWLGRKYFNVYDGDNVEEIVNLIVNEVAKIKKELEMI